MTHLYWGELHNHNEIGKGQGSLERSYEIARSHLDFYAFTPHTRQGERIGAATNDVVIANWEALQQAAAEHNTPGEFTTFLAYEWQSNAWGHVHVVYLDDHQPLHWAATLEELVDHFRSQRAILVPHHVAYDHGVDWALVEEEVSPVVEIFSEHGSSERDTGPYPMRGHSGGPGDARFTAQHGLSLGRRFGFTAGTDNHDGYPGGYGLGLTGVWAEANTREAIAEALRSRRTVAVTGDRIAIELRAGEACMGSAVDTDAGRELSWQVTGWDRIQQVTLVRDNEPVWSSPAPAEVDPWAPQAYRLRFEWGWGPMKGYQIFDWEGSLRVDGGQLQQVVPCFASDPFDEVRRKRVLDQDAASCHWQSHTSRGGVLTTRNSLTPYAANDALCVEVVGTPDTVVSLRLGCNTRQSLMATPVDWTLGNASAVLNERMTIGQLLKGRIGLHLDGVPTHVVAHRALPESAYTVTGTHSHPEDLGPAYYYLRVLQENGQMAWSSPIWLD
jgi:hypothetical protein